MFKINRLIARGELLSKPGNDYSMWLCDLKDYFESNHIDAGSVLVDDALQAGDNTIRFNLYRDLLIGFLWYRCNQNCGVDVWDDVLRTVLLVCTGDNPFVSDMSEYLASVGMNVIVLSQSCDAPSLMEQIVSNIDSVSIAVVINLKGDAGDNCFNFVTGYLFARLGDSLHVVCDDPVALDAMIPDIRCIDPHNWVLGLAEALRRDGVVFVDPRK